MAEGIAKGMSEGIAKGRAEVEAQREQEKLDSIKRLKASGVSLEIIMQAFDLPRNVIEQL
jgi:predicted transposase/invertase (TIGR01784 family)